MIKHATNYSFTFLKSFGVRFNPLQKIEIFEKSLQNKFQQFFKIIFIVFFLLLPFNTSLLRFIFICNTQIVHRINKWLESCVDVLSVGLNPYIYLLWDFNSMRCSASEQYGFIK